LRPQQREQGIALETLDAAQARELLPIAQFDDAALIGFEPQAGFADAYLTASCNPSKSAMLFGICWPAGS